MKTQSQLLEATGSVHNLHLSEEDINVGDIIDNWSKCSETNGRANLYHLDITLAKEVGKNDLLFSMSVMNGLMDNAGHAWICSVHDMYLPEMTFSKFHTPAAPTPGNPVQQKDFSFYKLLPTVICRFPKEVLGLIQSQECAGKHLIADPSTGNLTVLMNLEMYQSEVIQRPYQYLSLYRKGSHELENFSFQPHKAKDYEFVADCLTVLLK